MKADPQIWDLTTFLAAEGVDLLTDSASYFDKDNDLVLLLDQTKPAASTATIRFVQPIKTYQFIEIDIYAVGQNKLIDCIAVQDYEHYDANIGTYARASLPATLGHVRTYRLPFIGEIEAFVFSGFSAGVDARFVIRDIRFFSLPPTLRVIPPTLPDSITFELGLSYADLIGSYSAQVQRIQDYSAQYNETSQRYEITLFNSPSVASGFAEFNFISSILTLGLIRCTVPQLGRTGVGYTEIEDQLSVEFERSSSLVTETLVDLDKPIVPLRAVYVAPTGLYGSEGITYWFELFFLEPFADTNAWQTRVPQTSAFGPSNPLQNLRGTKGDKGDKGDRGEDGAPGPSGSGNTTIITFIINGTWIPPVGVTGAFVWGIGAGGGGGAGVFGLPGCGGGAGEEGSMLPLPVTPGVPISVTIGAKGIGGTSNSGTTTPITGSQGTDGGDTIVGIYRFCGGKAGSNSVGLGGGAGGAGQPQSGIVVTPSAAGTLGIASSANFFGGSSGGSAGFFNDPGYPGGGSGGRLTGGQGGESPGSDGGGGGGSATPYGPGGDGGGGQEDGESAGDTEYGTGGGGAGGGTGPLRGGDGGIGYAIIMFTYAS